MYEEKVENGKLYVRKYNSSEEWREVEYAELLHIFMEERKDRLAFLNEIKKLMQV